MKIWEKILSTDTDKSSSLALAAFRPIPGVQSRVATLKGRNSNEMKLRILFRVDKVRGLGRNQSPPPIRTGKLTLDSFHDYRKNISPSFLARFSNHTFISYNFTHFESVKNNKNGK